MTNVITCLFLIAGTTVVYRTLSRIETWWHREPEPERQGPSNCQVVEPMPGYDWAVRGL